MYQTSIHPYLIFGFGVIIGTFAGLILAFILGSLHMREPLPDDTARWDQVREDWHDAP